MKQCLKKYIELEKKISGWGWNQEEEKVDAPDAAWKVLFAAHKDNRKHYGFFQHNSFKFKDKLMRLFAEKIATGWHAHPTDQGPTANENSPSSPQGSNNDSIESDPEEGVTDDDDLSVTSQIWRAARQAEGDNSNRGEENDPFGLEMPLPGNTLSTALSSAPTRSATQLHH